MSKVYIIFVSTSGDPWEVAIVCATRERAEISWKAIQAERGKFARLLLEEHEVIQ